MNKVKKSRRGTNVRRSDDGDAQEKLLQLDKDNPYNSLEVPEELGNSQELEANLLNEKGNGNQNKNFKSFVVIPKKDQVLQDAQDSLQNLKN